MRVAYFASILSPLSFFRFSFEQDNTVDTEEETETLFRGERLNDEEFDELVSGFEDNQGNVDY